MNELQLHDVLLSMAGVAGVLWFFGAYHERLLWYKPRRAFLGTTFGFIFLVQTLSAFAHLSGASSVELFGFIGCMLGCFGAVRIMIDDAVPAPRATKRYET